MPRLQLTSNLENCRGSLGSIDVDFCKTLIRLEFGNIVTSPFTPALAEHSKLFSLIDCILVGVDQMRRSFELMRKQVEAWQRRELTDVTAKVVIYEGAHSVFVMNTRLNPESEQTIIFPDSRFGSLPNPALAAAWLVPQPTHIKG